MTTGRMRGRPKGRETVRVQALLYPEQKERLDFLSGKLMGSPPVTGLIREAVAEYLEKHFVEEVQDAFLEEQKKELRIVG